MNHPSVEQNTSLTLLPKTMRPRAGRSISAGLFALLLTGLVFAGCKVGPDYKMPQATVIPESYKEGTNEWKVAEPQAHLPKGAWWKMFGDAELNQLEQEAATA